VGVNAAPKAKGNGSEHRRLDPQAVARNLQARGAWPACDQAGDDPATVQGRGRGPHSHGDHDRPRPRGVDRTRLHRA